MTTITIPQKIDKEKELVAIPRKEYERFLLLEKSIKKVKNSTEKSIEKGLKDLREGRVHGPFSSVKDFKKYLNKHNV